MDFYSHPNKKLLYHLKEVRDYSINKIPSKLKNSYNIIALTHDFGKYTSYFQKYLTKGSKSDYSNHGFISAVYGAYIGLKTFGEGNILPLIIYNVVLHHHGNLENFSEQLPNSFKENNKTNYNINLLQKIEIGYKQIEDITLNKVGIEKEYEELGFREDFLEFINEKGIIENTLKKLKKIELLSQRNLKDEKNYFIHQILYSALISADKISASNIQVPPELYADYEVVNNTRKEKFKTNKTPMDKVRSEIFNIVEKNIKNNYKKSKVFSITSPTGTGKTYTGFFAALKLRELLGSHGKIIYSLPFTSIIEQNYNAIYSIFEDVRGFEKNYSSYIIKHHNLSNIEYETEYMNYSRTQAELLIENWNSGIVVTTFVQLLETLIGSRNRMLKKLNSLQGSIIILDEVQAIDIKYFELVDYILEKASKYFDIRIIIMTATKPIIMTGALELLEDNEKYFRMFNRTRIIPRTENITIDEFIEFFKENLQDKSYMIVCNTIKESLIIYDKLLGLDRDIYYLSTNILPIHRRDRIKRIKEKLDNNKKLILVSTQVVEAGVDLDFDIVIRDLGPIDSIIQCAGRCNRNNRNDIGDVYVFSIVDDSGKKYGSFIYGNSIISISQDILKDKNQICEKEYFDIINEYFMKIKKNKSQQASKDYIESINNLNFSVGEYSISRFSLIKNNPEYIDVFFVYDDTAEKTFAQYSSLISIKNFDKKRELYLQIERNLKDYIISIPRKYCKSFIEEKGMLILPREGIGQFYDENTGFIRDQDDICLIY